MKALGATAPVAICDLVRMLEANAISCNLPAETFLDLFRSQHSHKAGRESRAKVPVKVSPFWSPRGLAWTGMPRLVPSVVQSVEGERALLPRARSVRCAHTAIVVERGRRPRSRSRVAWGSRMAQSRAPSWLSCCQMPGSRCKVLTSRSDPAVEMVQACSCRPSRFTRAQEQQHRDWDFCERARSRAREFRGVPYGGLEGAQRTIRR